MLDSDKNIKVHLTTNPHDAVKIAKSINPDVILLDVFMPELDGIKVRRALLNSHFTRDIPVIFLTSSEDLEVEQQSKEAGCMAYMKKPANRADLIDNVKTSQAVRYISNALDSIKQARIMTPI
jgi:CheY-like chemotaxis protein